MNPTFSVLHATWGRPHKAIAAMRQWRDHCSRPQDVEYIFACNADDSTVPDLMDLLEHGKGFSTLVITDAFRGSAPAWDAAAKSSTGQWLIQAQDDLEPPKDWDGGLLLKIIDADFYPYGHLHQPAVIAVSDGYRKDTLQTIAIANRDRYEQVGEFIHSGYFSQFSDDDFSYRSIRDARAGKCTLIDARDLIFKHRHACHDPSVPFDATYARGSSPEAWAHGQALFLRRNPEAASDGLRTWT